MDVNIDKIDNIDKITIAQNLPSPIPVSYLRQELFYEGDTFRLIPYRYPAQNHSYSSNLPLQSNS